MSLARPRAVHALMSGLIDYAGLFPPAKLSMAASVEQYATYAASPESWMLGRFILPVSRIEEFRKAAATHLPRAHDENAPGGWPISAIIDGDLDENLDSIFAFNHEHQNPARGLAVIDAAEIKVPFAADGLTPDAEFIDDAVERIPEEIYPFFEIPILAAKPGDPVPDPRGCISALAGAESAAKVRTGGLTPESIPATRALAAFLVACHAAEVPFKATAGLHHAVRAQHPLTYEPGCPRSVMHGFLNVFTAAAMLLAHRIDEPTVQRILDETNPRRFAFSEGALTWDRLTIDTMQLERARELFALSYGSCSFTEPVEELRALGVI